VRYVLRSADFGVQMDFIKSKGWRGSSVTEALEHPGATIAITFDDGSETDLIYAVPLLTALGFGATFYLTAGFIGKAGYLSPEQVRQLCGLGFEIGCHSMTHSYLTDLDEAGLRREIVEAKSAIEQIVSQPVEHFSCPGGRYDRRVEELARATGYRSVATSRIQANSSSTNRFALGRVAVTRDVSLAAFEEICTGQSLQRLNRNLRAREAMKTLLGNSLYDRVRGLVLKHDASD
jgi:peptidoglycan/xylan/chitin deacetylase (PgdA/CDA1 family)